MKRILVIANRTLCEQHLLDELHGRRLDGHPVSFHLLVPASHPHGGWTDFQAENEARARLADMLDTLAAASIGATGEIGDANPVLAVEDLMRRGEGFDEIIISTLPAGVSRWLAKNVVRRLRTHTGLPVTHVIAERVPAEV
jgi:hypothetical protein